MLLVGAALVVCFTWLYYRDWQMKKHFRRYWEGKGRKPKQ
jgi:hypothetical protein